MSVPPHHAHPGQYPPQTHYYPPQPHPHAYPNYGPPQPQPQPQQPMPAHTQATPAAQPPAAAPRPAALPYIGATISLISKMNIRYEGTLQGIDAAASTVTLKGVRNFGTENRTGPFVPADGAEYELVVFAGKDISDLHVVERKAAAQPADPAILTMKAAEAKPANTTQARPAQATNTVRAIDGPQPVYSNDFDFQSANARFNKDQFTQKLKHGQEEEQNRDHETPAYELPDEDEAPVITVKYDAKKSFFDDLPTGNSGSRLPPRHVQRKQDAETFGDIAFQHQQRNGRGRGRGGQRGGNGGGYRRNDGNGGRRDGQGQWNQGGGGNGGGYRGHGNGGGQWRQGGQDN